MAILKTTSAAHSLAEGLCSPFLFDGNPYTASPSHDINKDISSAGSSGQIFGQQRSDVWSNIGIGPAACE